MATINSLAFLTSALNKAWLVDASIAALFEGAEVNTTEHRAALHTVLRSADQNIPAISEQQKKVNQVLKQMEGLVEKVHSGQWTGYTNKPIKDVVNIGIGGSDLGPAMACQALRPYQVKQLRLHFVSNIDPADISEVLEQCQAESTLFIIGSKTFTTLETLQNAKAARNWVLKAGAIDEDMQKHFLAVSTNIKAALEFGVAKDNILPMWDWVGGRYSLWSAIGLSIALAVGMHHFRELLEGAADMDKHFQTAKLENNMPVVMALIAIWYRNFWGCTTQAILPYSQSLARFPAYLQQLCMESNGKSVNVQGESLDYQTEAVIWGEPGTNGQHSFHQLLHQGTQMAPVDFILPLKSHYSLRDQQRYLVANCLGQSRTLMIGKSLEEVKQQLHQQNVPEQTIEVLAAHKVVPGNRPSNTLVFELLTPKTLGALIALYEHKVFVQSVIWNINAFDQWGVELGKQLGGEISEALLTSEVLDDCDASTSELIRLFRKSNAD